MPRFELYQRLQAVIDTKIVSSGRDWALAAGLSHSMVNQFIAAQRSGKERDIGYFSLQKLAQAADVDFGWLLLGDTLIPKLAATPGSARHHDDEDVTKVFTAPVDADTQKVIEAARTAKSLTEDARRRMYGQQPGSRDADAGIRGPRGRQPAPYADVPPTRVGPVADRDGRRGPKPQRRP